jgi:hypothetical protein
MQIDMPTTQTESVLEFGKTLESEYGDDPDPKVQDILDVI